MSSIVVLDGLHPRSRSKDPVTSVDAGRAADLCRSQSVVLAALRAHGEATQEQLVTSLPGMSPSRVRSAVSELAEQGLVAPTGDTKPTKYGRTAQVWAVIE